MRFHRTRPLLELQRIAAWQPSSAYNLLVKCKRKQATALGRRIMNARRSMICGVAALTLSLTWTTTSEAQRGGGGGGRGGGGGSGGMRGGSPGGSISRGGSSSFSGNSGVRSG